MWAINSATLAITQLPDKLSTKAQPFIYDLRNSLPELFLHADWLVIDEKRDYFD